MQKHLIWLEDDPYHLILLPPAEPPCYVRATGISFRQDDLQAFRRRWATSRHLLAWLWPDPTNEHHENAIRVMAFEPNSRETCQAGFLPRELADQWVRATTRFIEQTGFYPTFPASFIGGYRKYQNVGMLIAATEPDDWEGRMEAA